MYSWQVSLEYTNSIFFTWKGRAVNQHMALEYAKESAGLSKEVLGDLKEYKIKMLTIRGDK